MNNVKCSDCSSLDLDLLQESPLLGLLSLAHCLYFFHAFFEFEGLSDDSRNVFMFLNVEEVGSDLGQLFVIFIVVEGGNWNAIVKVEVEGVKIVVDDDRILKIEVLENS